MSWLDFVYTVISLWWWLYLNNHPPDSFHWHCDEWDYGVSKRQVKNQEMDICPTLHLVPAIIMVRFLTVTAFCLTIWYFWQEQNQKQIQVTIWLWEKQLTWSVVLDIVASIKIYKSNTFQTFFCGKSFVQTFGWFCNTYLSDWRPAITSTMLFKSMPTEREWHFWQYHTISLKYLKRSVIILSLFDILGSMWPLKP